MVRPFVELQSYATKWYLNMKCDSLGL